MVKLPNSVLYVKNGRGGQWWNTAKRNHQIHAGWSQIPADLIRNFDLATIEKTYRRYIKNGTPQDLNALKRLLDRPSQHVWITFQDGYLWWCLVKDRAGSRDGSQKDSGHLWLNCTRPWSNKSLGGRHLNRTDLPGPIQKVAGFRGTVCRPDASQDILRLIHDVADPKVVASVHARDSYLKAVKALITTLTPHDFEQLVEMILNRSGWERISKAGGVQEGIDLDVENAAMNERTFVQIKSAADQKMLDEYVRRFKQRTITFDKMIFAVHTPKGSLSTSNPKIHLWTDDEIAKLVIRLGLGERLERMRGHLRH